jgi:hypothetical protein
MCILATNPTHLNIPHFSYVSISQPHDRLVCCEALYKSEAKLSLEEWLDKNQYPRGGSTNYRGLAVRKGALGPNKLHVFYLPR